MKARRTTISLAALALALALALQACSTKYVGHKLAPDGSLQGGDTGVPYSLTRHEFTLKIAADPADANKPVYTLQRTSVPDPNQRYSLALAPGFLTDGTMTYNFGAAGNLGNAESSTTSQVVATIKAVVGLAANVIGAKTALKDEIDVWTRFMEPLKGNPPIDECKDGIGAGLAAYESELSQAAAKKFPDPAKDAAYKDKAERDAAEKAVKNQRAAWMADRFHYRTAPEQSCLSSVQNVLSNTEFNEARGIFDKAITEATATSAIAPAANDLRKLVDGMDLVAVSSKLATLDDKADAKLRVAYEKAKAYLTSVQSNQLATKLAHFYVDMPLDVWRARHLAQVESNIDKERFALQVLLANPPKSDVPKEVKTKHDEAVLAARRQLKLLEEQRDQLVDAAELKQRIAATDVLLNSGRTGSRDEGRAQLSADRDRLQGLWDQARADLLAKNQTFDLAAKPKAEKVKPQDDVPVTLVDESYVKGVNDEGKPSDKTRKFVVVMRRLPSPTPMQAASAAATIKPF